jgi:hypothetical protein
MTKSISFEPTTKTSLDLLDEACKNTYWDSDLTVDDWDREGVNYFSIKQYKSKV